MFTLYNKNKVYQTDHIFKTSVITWVSMKNTSKEERNKKAVQQMLLGGAFGEFISLKNFLKG